MEVLRIKKHMVSMELLNSVSQSEFKSEFKDLSENSQTKVFFSAVVKIMEQEIKEGQKVKVVLNDLDPIFNTKYLIAEKQNGNVWVNKESIENFFEISLSENEIETIYQRSLTLPKGDIFIHPLTERYNQYGKKITTKEKVNYEDVYFNTWGTASMLVNFLLNSEDTIDAKEIMVEQTILSLLNKQEVKVDFQELLEGVRNRKLASCLETCNLLREALETLIENTND